MTAGTPAGLAPVLKALGLSGMLDTLEARLAEARAGTLGRAALLPGPWEGGPAPAPRFPRGAVRARPPPPRRRQDHPADQGRPVPRAGHAGELRLRLQP